MTLTNYLKEQLSDFVDSYKNHFRQTLGVTIAFTVLCFVIITLLSTFNHFDKSVTPKPTSILSYFFNRYSKAKTYSIIDLTKTVFIFFVAVYSLGLIRLSKAATASKALSLNHFLRNITIKDVTALTGMLLITSYIDFILFKIGSFAVANTHSRYANLYISGTFLHLRIYLPLIAFALTIRFLANAEKITSTFKSILWLYISLWLYNEFAFEITAWVRLHVFDLILMPFAGTDKFYLLESLAGIPVVAFYFSGYYAANTTPLKLTGQA